MINCQIATAPNWLTILSSIIIPIFIFIVGFYVKELVEKNRKRKELELYKLLLVEWVNDSKKNIDQYIQSLGEFAERIKTSDSLNIVSFNTNLLGIERLSSLPLEKLMDSLLINLNVKKNDNQITRKLFNLIHQLEFLEENSKLVKNYYNKYIDDTNQLREEWNISFVDLTKNIGHNYNDITVTQFERNFYMYLMPLQMKIVEKQKENVGRCNNPEISRSIIMQEYINPSYNYGLQNESELSNSSKVNRTMSMLKEVWTINMKYDNHAKYGNLFDNINKQIIASKTILFESIQYYENHKIKSILKIK